jgi:hypothetical protein
VWRPRARRDGRTAGAGCARGGAFGRRRVRSGRCVRPAQGALGAVRSAGAGCARGGAFGRRRVRPGRCVRPAQGALGAGQVSMQGRLRPARARLGTGTRSARARREPQNDPESRPRPERPSSPMAQIAPAPALSGAPRDRRLHGTNRAHAGASAARRPEGPHAGWHELRLRRLARNCGILFRFFLHCLPQFRAKGARRPAPLASMDAGTPHTDRRRRPWYRSPPAPLASIDAAAPVTATPPPVACDREKAFGRPPPVGGCRPFVGGG